MMARSLARPLACSACPRPLPPHPAFPAVRKPQDLLARIEAMGGPSSQVVARRISGYGIFGFVRFLAGYYMIVITKRRKVALIGSHVIYRIEDTVRALLAAACRCRGSACALASRVLRQ